jgi:hypothetical protein
VLKVLQIVLKSLQMDNEDVWEQVNEMERALAAWSTVRSQALGAATATGERDVN